ncbi:hypothetical protein F8154_02540 [Alkaliphilus pronyensis]|uniref:Uncharacterized protein n=1 Tax=Alkaliphilus pronyensis TaxID=1482732 RepID=A0A6I0FES8_9FIRM|nr:hypothetical protein [Alkaliphilus pronyensis]KAB3537707.1 hypothetical protein F8154_02540 [Alkaliphilus pronyensis]
MEKCVYKGLNNSKTSRVKDFNKGQLKSLEPMSLISKTEINPLGFYDLKHTHFIVDSTEGVCFYFICNGENDIDWILEDISYDVIASKDKLQLTFLAGIKETSFIFKLNNVKSVNSITKLIGQDIFLIYYLMEQDNNYCYLGFQEAKIEDNIKKQILNHITYSLKSV